MFGKKTVQTENVPAPGIEPTPPQPISVEAELDQEERAEYARIAAEVGFHPGALVREGLLGYLAARNIPVFPYAKAKNYLDRKFGEKGCHYWQQKWGWRPLRNIDLGKVGLVPASKREDVANGRFVFEVPYQGPVPLEVLYLVKDISEAVPGAYFFISDQMRDYDPVGDPFLAASCPGLAEMIVIANWDEPGFGF